jgi:hypothetical protein
VTRRLRYTLLYAPEVHDYRRLIEQANHALLRRAIREQLTWAPDERTRNRKPLESSPGPFGATGELRCGPGSRFRVFYEIDLGQREVWILAIGVKAGNRLSIGGKEYGL